MLPRLLLLLTALSLTPASARVAYLTVVEAQSVTVGAGSRDGVLPGQILSVQRDGKPVGTVTVEWVSLTAAKGTAKAEATPLRVGDTVVLPPASVATDEPTSTPPQTPPTATQPGSTQGTRPLAGYVASLDGPKVCVSVGADQGAQAGAVLEVFRKGQPLTQLTLESVQRKTAAGVLRDAQAAVRVGDAVRGVGQVVEVAAGEAVQRPLVLRADGGNTAGAPLSPPKTYSVPRSDQSYDLLGALAAAGLVTKYPARVFYDEGLFRHRSDDDLVLTRRQIAELVQEALGNAGAGDALKPGTALALKRLTGLYAEELTRLGVGVPAAVGALDTRLTGGTPWGVGGYLRLRDTGANLDVAGESHTPDGLGLDMRGNLWADFGDKYRFRATLLTGADGDGLHTRLDRAAVTADYGKRLNLEVGRDRLWYGPGRFGSMLITDYARPYDYLKTKLHRGLWTYEGLVTTGLRRPGTAFMAHKVEVAHSPTVRFGVAETLVASGGRLPLDYAAAALVPVLPFQVVDHIGKKGDNPAASVYVETDLAKGYQTYVEFLIDDFVTRSRETSRNRTGFLFGSYWHDSERPDRLNLRVEYSRLDPGVYGPTDPNEAYFDLGNSLGYPLSPFANPGTELEDYRLEAQYKPMEKLTLGFGYEWTNLGFEQPVRSKQTSLRLRAAYDLSHNLSASLRYRRTFIQNAGSVAGVQVTDNVAEAELLHAF